MNLPPFALTYDYRCPFARNAHEHVVTALAGGATWDVSFLPFSLSQVHVEEGGRPVWEDPAHAPDLLALAASVVVRDRLPERFLDVHLGLFSARHDQARDLRDHEVVRDVLDRAGVDGAEVLAAVADGWPVDVVRKEHEAAADEHAVFGVPTFIAAGRAVFVRVMHRPVGDAELARATVEHVLDLVANHPELNEFKATTIPR